ncbi:hypothetical protein SAMN05192575_102291 [Nocardioides alpinus]|uniref:Asp23 family, cell envelope-related function n=1 Tax=Nocardioides alpinus TaxID=748909 RepID=A0A1I0XDB4_9ACTN|nr:hypothetical protein [Nocardioides alpinus]PKH44255.1 hypothetical protein CXG46_01480 [Nocardioides alpinus]SFA98416.1 hypothetical protein SAMN05192575_102291 [Nocardioides alpinus]
MALSPTGPLERAVVAAQAEEPEDWESVSQAVKRRVRATVMPSRPIVVVAADSSTAQDEHGSRTYVASRVVRAGLRDALRTRPDLTAERIDLTIDDDDRLTRVEIDLVCAYGTALPGAADDARGVVTSVVSDLLGAGTRPVVDVAVTDVVVGDARLT